MFKKYNKKNHRHVNYFEGDKPRDYIKRSIGRRGCFYMSGFIFVGRVFINFEIGFLAIFAVKRSVFERIRV